MRKHLKKSRRPVKELCSYTTMNTYSPRRKAHAAKKRRRILGLTPPYMVDLGPAQEPEPKFATTALQPTTPPLEQN